MRITVLAKLDTFYTALGLIVAGLTTGVSAATAQPNIPPCQPPGNGEYLLLIVSPTAASQNQLRQALPPNINPQVCRYLNDTVTRIGGFKKIDEANGWARYVKDIVGLSAFVTTRPRQPVQTANARPAPAPTSPTASYNPQQLPTGFAVLVDYNNNPEVATQVQQIVGSNVGLVAYGQRPYLLAVHTTNQREANSTLQTLSDRGFFAMLVDSRKVVILRSKVSF